MIENQYIEELTFDTPIDYKGLLIYPVKVREYLGFHAYVECFNFDKNSTPDIRVISMNYLEYLAYRQETLQDGSLYMLQQLLCMVLKLDESDITFGTYRNKFVVEISGRVFTGADLEEIKKIIMVQNGVEGIDDTIQKELRDSLDEALKFKNKQKMCSFEEQIDCLCVALHWKHQDIYDLTIRKFSSMLQRVDAKLHYQIYLSASMSGLVTFKDNDSIKHWMLDLTTKDKYAGVKHDPKSLSDKIT